MTYHVQAEWGPDADWHQQKTGFQVELDGKILPEARDQDPSLDNDAIHVSYGALREVAEWALGRGDPDVTVLIDAYQGKVVSSAGARSLRVEVTGHLIHASDVRRPVDASEERYLSVIRDRLSSLGIAEL